MFPESVCEIEWPAFHCHSTTEIFAFFTLWEQGRPQTQIRRPDVHCTNASAKRYPVENSFGLLPSAGVLSESRPGSTEEVFLCAISRCFSYPSLEPFYEEFLAPLCASACESPHPFRRAGDFRQSLYGPGDQCPESLSSDAWSCNRARCYQFF